jgi:2-(3-amino-3-carboxypropyl)histidine synthase
VLNLNIKGYYIDLEKAIVTITNNNYKNILLQIPEGLKFIFNDFADFIEQKTKANIIISADPCFGACDVPSFVYKNSDIDVIIQIGHLPIPHLNDANLQIGILTTAQHIHKLDEIKSILSTNNFHPIICKGDKRIDSVGQILGCNFSSATKIIDEVDMYLFIGSGTFHPLGLLLSTKKPVISCDPYTNEVKYKELEDIKDMILRQRYGAIARSKDAKVFGIVVCSKSGQYRYKKAQIYKKLIESKNKKSYILISNFFSASFLESFREIDCFVSFGCPRIAIDDYMQYKKPIITPIELEILLGSKKWDDYKFDEILV